MYPAKILTPSWQRSQHIGSQPGFCKAPASNFLAVQAEEEIPEGLASAQREPTPPPVLLAIMEHVASLAKRLQVPRPVVRRIVDQVRRGQHHTGRVDR